MSEENTNQPKEKTLGEKLQELLKDFPNAPSQLQIDEMKATHGSVLLAALSEDELFLFRPLTRKEHRALNAKIAEGQIAPELFEEQVVSACVLWKSVQSLEDKAGTLPSVFEMIMQNSNFLSPQALSNLVVKL